MYDFDFALSFAGEDRNFAVQLAALLKDKGARVFYDMDFAADLWGKDLYQEFQRIYGNDSKFFVPFISKHYIAKNWPKHELKQAQARDFKSDDEYILPLRIDDSELPGLNDTSGYLDLRSTSISEVANLCMQKLTGNLIGPMSSRVSNEVRLYQWLRERNPDAVTALESGEAQLLLRVATNRSQQLIQLIASVGNPLCQGEDMRNTLMNGGFGPPGCFGSVDAEPHTTFLLQFSSDFIARVRA
jgi:hypothetical protein